MTQIENTDKNDNMDDAGQCDVPDLLEPFGPVDLRRFTKIGIDTGKGRQVNDGAKTKPFPHGIVLPGRRRCRLLRGTRGR